MSHFFISYTHSDRAFAAMLRDRLGAADLLPWMDSERLLGGDDWRTGIDEAIAGASALLVVMSPAAKASEYVTYEWSFAWGAGVRVVPVLIGGTPLHPRLESIQYLDFTGPVPPWPELLDLLRGVADVARPTIRRMREELNSPDPHSRKSAVQVLRSLDHPAAREALAVALAHPLVDVRGEAAIALAGLGDARGVPALIRELVSRPTPRSDAAREALLGLKTADAGPHLVAALQAGIEDRWVRSQVYRALANVGAPADAGLLSLFGDDRLSDEVRSTAARLLGLSRCAAAAPTMEAVLSDRRGPERLRESVAIALGRVGDRGAVPVLEGCFRDEAESEVVRIASAGALSMLGEPGPVAWLIARSADRSVSGWRDVLRALVRVGTPEAGAAYDEATTRDIESWRGRDEHGRELAEAFYSSLFDEPDGSL